jgi:hypothetical protein
METTIKAMKPSEVAELYGVDVRTLNNWLIPFYVDDTLKRGNSDYYTPKQVKYIFDCLNPPENNLVNS